MAWLRIHKSAVIFGLILLSIKDWPMLLSRRLARPGVRALSTEPVWTRSRPLKPWTYETVQVDQEEAAAEIDTKALGVQTDV